MSELPSTIDALRGEVLAELPDAVIEEDFAELQRSIQQLEVERLRRLAEIERRRLFERDGHLSAAAWLASRFKVAWGATRQSVRVARALEDMPATRRALEEGEVSVSAVRILAAHDTDREAFGRSEAQLVEAARIHTTSDLDRMVTYWRQAVKERSSDGEEKLHARRRLHASRTFLGMVRVDGDLEPRVGRDPADGPPGSHGRGVPRQRWRGGRADEPPAARRRAHRDLPSVARPGRAAHRGRGAPPRHGDGRRGGPGRGHRGSERARSRRPGPGRRRPGGWPATPRCCGW